MRRRRDDRDARLAHRNEAETMLQDDAGRRKARLRLLEHPVDLGRCHLVVGGVLDRGHAVVVADGAEEDAGPAALGTLDLPEQRFDGDPGSRECIHHPPDNGGNNATSSPSLTRVSSFTCRRFSAASGRLGRLAAPGTISRTRRTTSPTVAPAGTATDVV